MFNDILATIKPLDEQAMERCQLRLDNLTKPLNSLHSFEHIARQLAGVTGHPRPRNLEKSIIIMAADSEAALAARGRYEQTLTVQKISNFCQGRSVINSFAEHAQAKLVLVDIGVAAGLPPYAQVRHEKIAYGTANMLQGPALTRTQTIQAIKVGIQTASEAIASGVQVIGLGEMGIAGTISGLAVASCYSEQPLENLTGRERVIIRRSWVVNEPDKQDPLDVLTKVGSLSMAGLVGVIIGAAAGRAAVVLDGLVTSAAALLAVQMAPAVKAYLIGSHFAAEPGHREVLGLLGLPAYLKLDMNLGEGTGAALGMSLITASLHVINDMKTFGEAEVAVAQDGPGALKQNKAVRD
ncbi:nicotinate-nucleotide--dimethylbenzimidazole phosphoribosyltransferase [Sporomusa sphaeroides DSM 2875]|uniref:nicotinate-nucleotide--dimethylbenzimidazole phosphoribosyltransferase n=1 Tax=Sporomusa sphaeroides TaxID=47679 RepID=UPI00202E9F35|nr:nicotinate-nucleotide--dimethylbenzimidazole phosphoribosyltransferase [Sporomusa sphaeroides]MCM0758984.1 nicotinate-nucleotide--dimethylbenzimidazole phosphoribosyltransferase [Sporomusa sphaeroides DSM 2875]